ncbi:NAD(P)-binding protein [Coniochaeta ligniaria NRRL 30616]|uniref:D-xylose 1-dehydrogenase (NADP(+), D-xylono-1,5-lactone-forming) n=1 Tax=Coniochaeta ligniaria NRRL 30616 TaxID=1408157 RepID=A0A1J7JBA8_9PEZI|nr:NAD(P)-binding protein [Coniochaeta ligniaria NRRL 30616]
MASAFCDLLHRNWQILRPPAPPPKATNALRFGILGTSRIAPFALITPSRSHPEVILSAHSIPRVLDSYADLVNDKDIDAVYVPLPTGLHYEWAMRCLAAGKHVLLEKPSTANGTEAEELFKVAREKGLVVLEARHFVFQPSWRVFLGEVEGEGVERVEVTMCAPGAAFGKGDIRFRYELGGGAMLDLGTYHVGALRAIFGAEAEECLSCEVSTCAPPNELCDTKFNATFRFPNGGTGEMYGNIKASLVELATNFGTIQVWHRKKRVEDEALPAGQEKWVTRREVKKAYTLKEAGVDRPSEKYWLTYRYMLEEFVNKIRGREGSDMWVDGEDSVRQMRMLDMAYEKAGLPLRKSPEFKLETAG